MSGAPQTAEQQEHEQRDLAIAAEAGIHRLAIPTPFMVGRVNAYLIEDSPADADRLGTELRQGA